MNPLRRRIMLIFPWGSPLSVVSGGAVRIPPLMIRERRLCPGRPTGGVPSSPISIAEAQRHRGLIFDLGRRFTALAAL